MLYVRSNVQDVSGQIAGALGVCCVQNQQQQKQQLDEFVEKDGWRRTTYLSGTPRTERAFLPAKSLLFGLVGLYGGRCWWPEGFYVHVGQVAQTMQQRSITSVLRITEEPLVRYVPTSCGFYWCAYRKSSISSAPALSRAYALPRMQRSFVLALDTQNDPLKHATYCMNLREFAGRHIVVRRSHIAPHLLFNTRCNVRNGTDVTDSTTFPYTGVWNGNDGVAPTAGVQQPHTWYMFIVVPADWGIG